MKIMREWIKIEIVTPINTRTVTQPNTITNPNAHVKYERRLRTYSYLSPNGEGELQINYRKERTKINEPMRIHTLKDKLRKVKENLAILHY